MTSSCSTVHVCTYVALITAMKTGSNNVSLEWSTEHVRGEGEEPTEEGRNRGAGPLEAGWQGRPRPLHSFYCGLIPFFAREVWPVILHAHGPKGFHTSRRNTFYHSTSFLVPANGRSTPHKLLMAMRGQLVHVHLLPVCHLRLEICSCDPIPLSLSSWATLVSLPQDILWHVTEVVVRTCTCTCTYGAYVYKIFKMQCWGV